MPVSKKKKVLIASVAMVAVGGTAFAYWSATGSGSGTGTTASGVTAVTIVQTSTVAGLAPGSAPVALSGTFTNPNDGPVHVNTLSVAGVVVTKAAGAPVGTCDATDYTIVGSPLAVAAEAAVDDTTVWGAGGELTIAFNNKATNQDACKDASLVISYTSN